MDQLRFTGLHEDGAHLVVTATDGTDFIVAADERLRAALRQSAAPSGPRTVAATPREVQTHIRAGLSAEEVAEGTGWTVERVQRYEGPILAERAHVAQLGSGCLVRTHDRSGPAPTLEARVRERLQARGVNTDHVTWDSKRPEGGQWSVQVQFMAGQRVRHASWSFDVAARSVEAIDDEARWLSEDEQTLPTSTPAAAVFGTGIDGPDDLISSMRERSRRRGQTGARRRKGAAAAADTDLSGASPIEGDQELPLEDLLTADQSDRSDQAEVATPEAAFAAAQRVDGDKNADDDLTADDDLEAEDEGDGHTTLDDFFGLSDDEGQGENTDDPETEDNETHAGDDDALAMDTDDDDVDLEVSASGAEHGDAVAAGNDSSVNAEPASVTKSSAPSRARKGRPSVPSWDDIMFGARDRKD